jgi:preprotein translocase subunit SecE
MLQGKLMTLDRKEGSWNTLLHWVQWLAIIALFCAGVFANLHYASQPWPLRLLGWLFLIAVMLGIASQTVLGKSFLRFAFDARMELRKVFWPTRQETIQTTLIVVAAVIFLALFLWGVDTFLMWLIGWLTGQRG